MKSKSNAQAQNARPFFAARIPLALALALALAACGQKSEMQPQSDSIAPLNAAGSTKNASAGTMSAAPASAIAPARAETSANEAAQNASGTAASTTQQLGSNALAAAPKGRQLVRTGALSLSVKDVYQSNLAIEEALAAHGGFVVQSNIVSQTVQQASYPAEQGMLQQIALISTTGELILRLPSDKASAFLRSIANQILTIESRTLAANDVQFDLLRQQLEAARAQATAQELAQLTQQAGRIAEKNQTIAQRRQAAVEANEAQLGKLILADQVDFATLTLHLTQTPFVRTSTAVHFGYLQEKHRPSLAARAGQALADGWHGLLSALLAVMSAWPLLLIGAGAALALRRTHGLAKLRHALRRKPRGDAKPQN